MLRATTGVIVGYAVMFMIVFVTFTGAYLAMGADGAFRPGSYEVSELWIAVSIVLGLIAAVAGGLVCRAIARSLRPALVLAGLVLVLGLAMAVPVLRADVDPASRIRAGDVSNLEAMANAQQPPWMALLTPFIGAFGVMVGARLRRAPRG